jgi:hypothetical protein
MRSDVEAFGVQWFDWVEKVKNEGASNLTLSALAFTASALFSS